MHYDPQILQESLSSPQIERLPKALIGTECVLSLIQSVVARCWITTLKEKQTFVEIAGKVQCFVEKVLKQLEVDLAKMEEKREKRG